MPCNPWPNSWNNVRASSKERRAGSPGDGFEKFITLMTIGLTSPPSFFCPRKLLIQAPECLPGRAK